MAHDSAAGHAEASICHIIITNTFVRRFRRNGEVPFQLQMRFLLCQEMAISLRVYGRQRTREQFAACLFEVTLVILKIHFDFRRTLADIPEAYAEWHGCSVCMAFAHAHPEKVRKQSVWIAGTKGAPAVQLSCNQKSTCNIARILVSRQTTHSEAGVQAWHSLQLEDCPRQGNRSNRAKQRNNFHAEALRYKF